MGLGRLMLTIIYVITMIREKHIMYLLKGTGVLSMFKGKSYTNNIILFKNGEVVKRTNVYLKNEFNNVYY